MHYNDYSCLVSQYKRNIMPILVLACAVSRCDKENLSRWDTSVNHKHSFISAIVTFIWRYVYILVYQLMRALNLHCRLYR